MLEDSEPLYYIGVDGGGTKCRARLKNRAGKVLGEGLGGPSNVRLGLATVWQNLMTAIDAVLGQAGLSRADLPDIHLGLGLAGISTETNAQVAIDAGPAFGRVRAASDAHIACLGAFSGRDGAILIAGTGSAGYAFIDGVSHAVGGWGFEVGDDGSAAGLGRAAVRAALRGHDLIAPETDFTRQVISAFGGNPADVIAFVTTATPSDFGALAPMVIQAAEEGDPVATHLVRQVAKDISLYLTRLRALGAGDIALVGGMADPILSWLPQSARVLLTPAKQDAVEGALLLAQGADTGLARLVAAS